MRFEGAASFVGFSTIWVNLPSLTESTPYLETFSGGISTPRIAERPLAAWTRVVAADSPSGFQTKSSPMNTKTGSLMLYSSTTRAIGTAVPYLSEGFWTV